MHAFVVENMQHLEGEPPVMLDVYKNMAAYSMITLYLAHENTPESRAMATYYLDMFYEAQGNNATVAAIALAAIGKDEATLKSAAFKRRVNNWLERSAQSYAKADEVANAKGKLMEQDRLLLAQQQKGIQALQAFL